MWLVLTLLVAACGTTVEGAEDALRADAGSPNDDFTLATPTAEGAPGATGSATPGTARGSNRGSGLSGDGAGGKTTGPESPVSRGAAGGAEPTATTAPTGGKTSGGSPGPGVTDTTVKIGLLYDRNAGALNAAYGFAGIGQIDQKKAWESLVGHINDNGGVAGRKIEVVWYEFDQLAGKTPEQVAQEACATWTQDHRVFAAVTGPFVDVDAMSACLAAAGAVHVSAGQGFAYSETFERFPDLVDVGTPALDHLARFSVESLAAQGFYDEARPTTLGGDIKVGLVAYDLPAFKTAAAALERALGDHGIELSEKALITRGETSDQLAQEATQIRSAALKFKEQGITHVQFLMTSNAFGQFTFWQNADSLQYQPRYGLTSMDAAQALTATFESSNPGGPRRQFEMAVGAGWGPLRDVPRADYSGDAESPELRRCKAVTKPSAGSGFDDPSRGKEIIAAAFCDPIFYLKAALDAGGPIPNLDSWRRGVASVSGLGAAATFLLRTDTQRDAVGMIRDFAYFSDCNCFHYTSKPRRI